MAKRLLFWAVVLMNLSALTGTAQANPLLHNSVSTGSAKWPIAQSGKAVDGWGIPNAKYGEFTCGTCHIKNTSNIKRVRTTLTAPDAADQFPVQAAGGTVNFQSTTGPASFGDDGRADKTRSNLICEACHSKTAVHRYDSSTGVADFNHKNANQTDCIACHQHKVGFKPSGCNTCHGDPPTVAGELVTGADATGSTTAGAHQTHAVTLGYACDNCHSGYVMPNGGDIDINFSNFGSTTGTYTGQTTATYNGAIGTGGLTCNTVYCHSTGQSANGASVTPSSYSAPTWTGTAACGSCHSNVDPATGSHTAHINDGALCTTCHAGNVHVNRVIDVGVGAYTAAGAPGNGYGTCSTANCHDNGTGTLVVTPTWGTASACAECHLLQPATGSHSAHLSASATCGDCHGGAVEGSNAGTAHRDTNIDTVVALGYTQNKAKGSAYTTCATASCHNDGRNAGLTGTWGTTQNNCSECHATVPATGGHGVHVGVSFGGAAIACADCHAGTTQGTTAGAGHRDGNVDVSAGSYTPNKALGSAFTTCTTATCHQTGISANNYVTTTAWGTNDANCTSCHAASPATGSHTKHIASTNNCTACHGAAALKDVSYNSAAHGDLNIDVTVGGYAANKVIGSAYTSCSAVTCHSDGMAASGNTPVWGGSAGCAACHASNMTTGSHGAHLTAGALCGDCHDGAVKDVNAGMAHTDGNVDVTATYATPNAAYGSATWTTCSSASCHDDGRAPNTSAAWGTTVNNCAECHATQPATGSHTSHLSAGAVCGDCHSGTTQGTTAGANHRDGNVNATGYPVQAKGSAFTTCATATCHDTGRNGGGATGTWGTTLNNCSECHATVPATAAHAKHVTSQTITSAIVCAACHVGTTQGTTAGAGHRDGNIDVSIGGYPADKALGSAYTNCTTSYCHSNGKGTIQSVNWSATSTGCTFCHGNPPAGTHSAGDTDCSSCHNHVAAADNAFSNAALHINGTVEAQADDCTVCHGVGKSRDPEAADPDHKAHTSVATMLTGKKLSTSDYGNAAWWYSVSYDATSKPLMGCGQCHPADVAAHRNSFVETKLTATGEAGIPATNAKRNNGAAAGFSTGTGKCSAVYCHGDGINDGTYPDSPVWDLTYGNAGLTCASCHGNSPTTGTHNWHEVGIHYKTLYDDDGDGLMPAGAAPATDAGAAHGNTATADTIGCQTCHNNTVTVEHNAGNTVCGSCHSDTNAPATGNEMAVIKASSSAHLDGAKTVFFANLGGFKSKSQLRNDITTVPALTSSWTRTNSYKAAAGNSFDAAKNAVPTWNSGAQTCSTVDCHNGIITPAWSAGSTANCLACHTTLPQ